jgi:hypothetical protein
MVQRVYNAPDGEQYPVEEARVSIHFVIYRTDLRRAVKGDPHFCILALGLKRCRNVLDAYIGSGSDAYVIFGATAELPAIAIRYIIPEKTRKIINTFDTVMIVEKQTVELKAPSPGSTLEHRRMLNKKRRLEIKNGAPVKSRGKIHEPRIIRLGVPNRPTAPISQVA